MKPLYIKVKNQPLTDVCDEIVSYISNDLQSQLWCATSEPGVVRRVQVRIRGHFTFVYRVESPIWEQVKGQLLEQVK